MDNFHRRSRAPEVRPEAARDLRSVRDGEGKRLITAEAVEKHELVDKLNEGVVGNPNLHGGAASCCGQLTICRVFDEVYLWGL